MATRAFLFDWRGTLFYDQADADWLIASAAAIGRQMGMPEAEALIAAIGAAASDPEVAALAVGADTSAERHRAAGHAPLRPRQHR